MYGIRTPVIAGLAIGIAFVSGLAIFFPFVGPNATDDQKVWVVYTTRQCEEKPWGSIDFSQFPEEYQRSLIGVAYGAAKYYEGQGIVVYNFTIVGAGISPAVCGYPDSDVFLQVPKVQAIRMLFEGFRLHDPSPQEDEALSQHGHQYTDDKIQSKVL